MMASQNDFQSRIEALQVEVTNLHQEMLQAKDDTSRKALLEVLQSCAGRVESPMEAIARRTLNVLLGFRSPFLQHRHDPSVVGWLTSRTAI